MATEEEVRLIFKAVNQYSATTTDLTKRLDEISRRADVAQRDAQDLGRRMQEDLGQGAALAERNLGSLASGGLTAMRTLAGGVGLATGGIVAAGIAIDKFLDFGEAGARIKNLEMGFENLATRGGHSARQLLSEIQAASGSIMSEADAMQQYNEAALLLGQGLASRYGEIVTMARATSGAGLGTFEQQLSSLITGVSKLQPEILDNLAIVADWPAVYEAAAVSMGTTADELSKLEKQTITLNEVKRQLTEKIGDLDQAAEQAAGQGIARLRAATENYVNYVMTEATPAIDGLADAAANLLLRGQRGSPQWAEYEVAGIEKAAAQYELYMSSIIQTDANTAQGMELLQQQFAARIHLLAGMGLSEEQWQSVAESTIRVLGEERGWLTLVSAMQRDVTVSAGAAADATDEMGQAMAAAERKARRFAGAVSTLASDTYDAIGAMDDLQRSMNRMERERQGGIVPGRNEFESGLQGTLDWYESVYGVYVDQYLDAQAAMARADEDRATRGGSALSDMSQAWDSYVTSWQSGVDAILQPTQGFELDNILDQMGMHRDKWDEPARRMASIMNEGSASEWFASMGSQWAGQSDQAIKGNAANWIASFYRGDMPTEINWGAFDTALQEQMSRQANWENIKQMAYARAEGMGLGPDSSLVMQAFGESGIGGALGSGAAMAADVTEGFRGVAEPQWEGSGSKDAEAYYGAFSAKFEEEDWTNLGSAAGASIKNGILDAAREAGSKFLDELAQEVSPYVARHLAENDEFTP